MKRQWGGRNPEYINPDLDFCGLAGNITIGDDYSGYAKWAVIKYIARNAVLDNECRSRLDL